MKKRLLFLSLACCLSLLSVAQGSAVALIPYLAESYGSQTNALLTDKLRQIATQNGFSGSGFDDRFVITARLINLDKQQTATIPSKTALRLSVSLYIGDGYDGTLFSSYSTEVRGIGNDEAQARLNAVRKLSATAADVQTFVMKGRKSIDAYYENKSADIIAKANAQAQSGQFDQAIITLSAIPSSCSAYSTAQHLIARYGMPAIENNNKELLLQAKAAWSSQPNEAGAAKARRILVKISYPSQDVENAMHQLTNEMATRLQQERDYQWSLLAQEQQNLHETEMELLKTDRDIRVARIQATAQVEAAWASRPVVNYHVHWW